KEKGIDGTHDLATSFKIALEGLVKMKPEGAVIVPENLEAVVLDRTMKKNRKVRRLEAAQIKEWLEGLTE
ncbi:hypothetical protein ACFLU6_08460, partial [Acidobacteriota bacterium]